MNTVRKLFVKLTPEDVKEAIMAWVEENPSLLGDYDLQSVSAKISTVPASPWPEIELVLKAND